MTLLTAANFKIKNPSDVNIQKFNQSLAYLQKSPLATIALNKLALSKTTIEFVDKCFNKNFSEII